MSKPSLSVFQPETNSSAGRTELELDRISGAAAPKTVSLTLSQLAPLLIDAVQHDRAWLSDFADDPVRIDADLYDVLLAYQQLRDRAA